MALRKDTIIPDTIVDQLLADANAERVLNAGMDHHLDGDDEAGNRRNGYGKKTVTTDSSSFAVEIPRDREARFDPQLIAKYQRRFPGFDDNGRWPRLSSPSSSASASCGQWPAKCQSRSPRHEIRDSP